MKRSNKKGLFSVLVALIIVALLFSATVSADREEGVPTTLAIGNNKVIFLPVLLGQDHGILVLTVILYSFSTSL
jgi:hypothetical protein